MASRRQFLKAGALGSAALLLAGYWAAPAKDPDPAAARALRWLSPLDAQIVAALAPVLLGLPGVPSASVVDGVDRAVAGLPFETRREVRQLFDLLGNRWARRWLAGVRSPWQLASARELGQFLQRWRESRFALQCSAYQGLHRLIHAGWYGNPASWAALGYNQPAAVMGMLP
ncbi:twin-arginine translocation signal domain-containing protein [Chromobacterium violaceum]|uniref:twin-arginine translocation signal domain-containing protein n=1 Tax=Chromobacterium violaceum TaxID=536 RepID=UPI0005D3B3DC|nr:twin-arginine translocation signal domain-containing protein [Chromobacterium violaceum]